MFKAIDSNPNFPEIEKKLLEHWYKDGIIDKYLKKNSGAKKTFSYQDGPITANNPMGIHHAWGRTYKDLWQKVHNLFGYRQRFRNGFDCQGLWVEVEVEKELGLKTKKDIENLIPGDRKASIAKFVDLCKSRVYKFSKIQTEQSKRLGYFMDWENSYFTMSDENNYMIWHFLKKCYENGWIYKGHDSVPWCPRCETAISQHEMLTEDYKEITHDSIILEFSLVGKPNEYLLVWTTTPWTIPANIAIAVDENIFYSLVKGNNGDLFWVAKDLVESVFGKDNQGIIKTVKGKELVGLRYNGPFDHLEAVKAVKEANPETFHTVIATDEKIMPISTTEGTGLVHTAVSAGTEDFLLGKKYQLPMIPVIADNADYLPGLGEFSGKNAKKDPWIILGDLKTRDKKGENLVFKIFKYKHRYPACWRCKEELVWKVADEWYIAMDKKSTVESLKSKVENNTLRERMIEVTKKITWMPEFGLDRELDWLKNMHDWLISKKNRYWGLALPIYECKKCGFIDVIGGREELQKRATKGWGQFEGNSPHKPYIDEVKIKCQKCGAEVSRIDDVGNPWLDAGIVPYSTICENNLGKPLYLIDREKWLEWFPVDYITESFPGQFKNWFYSMIAMSAVLENINPFKRVLGYGTLLGEDGRPMHKSWGNSIEFNEGADKIGVDVIRWMFCRQNPAENMLFGYKKADEVRRQFYLLLWNIYKFFVEYANLDKFENFSETPDPKSVLDEWIIARFYQFINKTKENFDQYDVKSVAIEGETFINDLSTWYIRRSRNRVWINSESETDKKSFYSTLYFILANITIILSPLIPFITDLIYTNLTGKQSVHLAFWPDFKTDVPVGLIQDMELVRKIAEVGHRIRKESKLKLRQPLASVVITLPKKVEFILGEKKSAYVDLIKDELNVKCVNFKSGIKEEIEINYDTQLTDELIKEGKLRDLIREIQRLRKEKGTHPEAKISLCLPSEFSENQVYLSKKLLIDQITIGETLKIL